MKLRRFAACLLLFLLLFSCLPFSEFTAYAEEMPYRIEVDLTSQIVTIYKTEDGSIAYQMLCSSGANNATPRGTFTLPKNKYPTERQEWYYFPAFGCYAKYATRIYQGILFHSIPYNRTTESSISKSALKEFGAPASHGCIRLRWEDAKFIAQNCLAGTEVKIFYADEADEELRSLLRESSYSSEFGMTYNAFLGIPDEEGVLGRYSIGEEVTNLQYRLRALGFYSAEITGEYKSATITAVKQMQEALGLEPNGYATPELLEIIYSADAPTSNDVELIEGMSGPCVRNLQTDLQTLQLYAGELDGIYDIDVIDSVNLFKQVYGYPVDDIATSEVQKAIAYEADNIVSFFDSKAFTLEQTTETIPMATVSARKRVRIRAEASTDSASLEKVSNGDMVILLEQGDKWSQIRNGETIGYMMNDYLEFTEQEMAMLSYSSEGIDDVFTVGSTRQDYLEGAELPATLFSEYLTSLESHEEEAIAEETVNFATVNTGVEGAKLRLRASPTTDGEVIAELENGTQLNVLLKSAEWTLVSHEAGDGYLMNEYLEFSYTDEVPAFDETQPVGNIYATVHSGADVYNIDSEDATAVASLGKDTRVRVIRADDDWSLVEYDGQQGYMRNEDLSFILTEDYI